MQQTPREWDAHAKCRLLNLHYPLVFTLGKQGETSFLPWFFYCLLAHVYNLQLEESWCVKSEWFKSCKCFFHSFFFLDKRLVPNSYVQVQSTTINFSSVINFKGLALPWNKWSGILYFLTNPWLVKTQPGLTCNAWTCVFYEKWSWKPA